MRKILLILSSVAVLILIGVNLYVYFSPASLSTSSNTNTSTVSTLSTRTPPAGQKEYAHAFYKFSLFYPENLTVREFEEVNNARTIIFEDRVNQVGFQIYVTPYGKTQIDQDRFIFDRPSGVREGFKDITIDGAVAAEFYSRDQNLSDTKEAWFIHDGFLYEITTLKPLDLWLLPIIQTWKFL